MEELEESIVTAMELTDNALVKYLPYIFQDHWELGTSSDEIIEIIRKHTTNYSNLSVLDLGSGKGAISIKISSELKCKCFGIEGLDDFVIFSNNKAKEFLANNICTFEKNDIRTRLETLGKYDIILLIAIGPVLGNYFETLSKLSPHLNEDGLIIIDDAYVEENSSQEYPNVLSETEIIKQIKNAGMKLIEKTTINDISTTHEKYENDFRNIKNRCMELAEKYPENKKLFLEYVERQIREYEILSNEIVPAIFVIKK